MKEKINELKNICSTSLEVALKAHLENSTLKTLDCANASTETTDFYINLEKENCKASA